MSSIIMTTAMIALFQYADWTRLHTATELHSIVKAYPGPAEEADFENLMDNAHKDALAGACSINTYRKCSDKFSFAAKFSALGFTLKRKDWIDKATLCVGGKSHGVFPERASIMECDPGHEKWREGCEVSWCKKGKQ